MIPKPAQYLVRFDDLCPTSSWPRWERFLSLMEEFSIQPILAVVPDNQDPDLQVSLHDPEFWSRVRGLESAGATIGLHGYRHLAKSRGRGLMPLHRTTEFAGVHVKTQRMWIRAGLGMLRYHGLNPRIWVAPRHGFDANTLAALRMEGIPLLSDGFARMPFLRGGVTWIPQQIWEPEEKAHGIWTICVHPNTADDLFVDRLRAFICIHRAQFTSVERVLTEMQPGRLNPIEHVYAMMALGRFRIRNVRKRLSRR